MAAQGSLLPLNPGINMLLEHVERHRPVLKYAVVELTHVELGTQLFLCRRAQLPYFQLPQLVSQRLTWPDDIAINLDGDVLIRLPGIVFEELYGLIARPPHRMHPGIDHQANGAPHLVGELAELRIRILQQPNFFPEALGIQRPAFNERRIADMLAELRHVLHLLPQGKRWRTCRSSASMSAIRRSLKAGRCIPRASGKKLGC